MKASKEEQSINPELITYKDPASGVLVTQLTNYKGHSHHFYFTNAGWYAGGRKLLFGSDRNNRANLFGVDLATGEIEQLREGQGVRREGRGNGWTCRVAGSIFPKKASGMGQVSKDRARPKGIEMSSDSSFVEFIVDQMEDAGAIAHRKMFGEYAVYCDGKVVALVCDNQLFVKPKRAMHEEVPHAARQGR